MTPRLPRSGLVAICLAATLLQVGEASADVIPFSNLQPSLALDPVLITYGIYPAPGNSEGGDLDTVGFVHNFAGSVVPSGSIAAQGQVLSISQNLALFSALAVYNGGNGYSTFAVPDLSGRLSVGIGAGTGIASPIVPGQTTGSSTVTLTPAQLPAPQGSGQSFDNYQPSLALTPLIAISGANPLSNDSSGNTFLGEIADFAGNFTPSGWAPADGRLLSIADYPDLFAVIGTTYGGDGVKNFALPDLRGRTAVGASPSRPVGTYFGDDSTSVTTSELPPAGSAVNDDQPSLAINYLVADYGLYGNYGFGDTTLGDVIGFAGNFAPHGYLEANGQLLPIVQDLPLFSILVTRYGGNGVTNFALPDLEGRAIVGYDADFPLGSVTGTDQVFLQGTSDGGSSDGGSSDGGSSDPGTVPEPATWTGLLTGLLLIGRSMRSTRAKTERAAA